MDFNFAFMGEAFLLILPALPMTLLLMAATIISGFCAAVLIAYVRYYSIPGLNWLAKFFVSFFRGTPIVMHIFLVFYGVPLIFDPVTAALGISIEASSIPLWIFAVTAFSFSAAANFAEILRAGIMAIAKGEIEAAYSIGMTHWQTMLHIILPQAFILSLPSLGARCIAIMQTTSLAFLIAVVEITAKANLVAADTYQFMEAMIAAGIIYWIMTFIFERILRYLETRKHFSFRS